MELVLNELGGDDSDEEDVPESVHVVLRTLNDSYKGPYIKKLRGELKFLNTQLRATTACKNEVLALLVSLIVRRVPRVVRCYVPVESVSSDGVLIDLAIS